MKKARKPISLLLALAMVFSLAAAMPLTALAEQHSPTDTSQLQLNQVSNNSYTIDSNQITRPDMIFTAREDGVYYFYAPTVKGTLADNTTEKDYATSTITLTAKSTGKIFPASPAGNPVYYYLEGGESYNVHVQLAETNVGKPLSCTMSISQPSISSSATVTLGAGDPSTFYNFKAPAANLYTFRVSTPGGSKDTNFARVTLYDWETGATFGPSEVVPGWNSSGAYNTTSGAAYAVSYYMNAGDVACLKVDGATVGGESANLTVEVKASPSVSSSTLSTSGATGSYVAYRTWRPSETGLYTIKLSAKQDGANISTDAPNFPKLGQRNDPNRIYYYDANGTRQFLDTTSGAAAPGLIESGTKQYLFYVSHLTQYIIPVYDITQTAQCSIRIDPVATIKGTGSKTVTAAFGWGGTAAAPVHQFDFAYLVFEPNESTWYNFTADAGDLNLVTGGNLVANIGTLTHKQVGTVIPPFTGTAGQPAAADWDDNLNLQEPKQKATVSGYFENGKIYIFTYRPYPTEAEANPVNPADVNDYTGTISVSKLSSTMSLTSTTSLKCLGKGTYHQTNLPGSFTSYFAFTPAVNSTSTRISIKAGAKNNKELARITGVAAYKHDGTKAAEVAIPGISANGDPIVTLTAQFRGGETYYIGVQTDAETTCTVEAVVKITPSVNNHPIDTDKAEWGPGQSLEGCTVVLKQGNNVITPEADGTYMVRYGGTYTLSAEMPNQTAKTVTFTADGDRTVNVDLIRTADISVTLNPNTSGSYCSASTSKSVSGTTTTVTVNVTAKDLVSTLADNSCWLDVMVAKPAGDTNYKVGWGAYNSTNAVDITAANATIKQNGDVNRFSFQVIPADGEPKNAWIEVSQRNTYNQVVSQTIYILRFGDNYKTDKTITVKNVNTDKGEYEYKVTQAVVRGSSGQLYEDYIAAGNLANTFDLINRENSPMSAYAASLVQTNNSRKAQVDAAVKIVDRLYPTVMDSKLPNPNPDTKTLRQVDFDFYKKMNPELTGTPHKYLTAAASGTNPADFVAGKDVNYLTGDYFNTVVVIPYLRVDMTAYSSPTEFAYQTTPYVMVLVTSKAQADAINSVAAAKAVVEGTSNLCTQYNPDTGKEWTHAALAAKGKKIQAIVVKDDPVESKYITSASSPMTFSFATTAGKTLYAKQGGKYIYNTDEAIAPGTYKFTSYHGIIPNGFVVTETENAAASINGRVEGEIKYVSLEAAIEDAKTGEFIYYLPNTDNGADVTVNAKTASGVKNLTIVDKRGAALSKANIVINGVKVTNGTYAGGSGGTDPTPSTSPTPDSKRNIVVAYSSNGTVSVTPNPAAKGARVTLTARPSNGYRLNSITATGTKNGVNSNIALTSGGNNTFTFVMPDVDSVTVSATFLSNATVTLISRTGGSLKASSTMPSPNSVVTITATPNTGYALSGLSVVNSYGQSITTTVSSTNSNVYTFTMPSTGSVTVTPTWVTTTVNTVTIHAASGGAVTASSAKPAVGAAVVLTVKPNSGYELSSIMVRGAGDTPVTTKKTSSTTYRFTMPAGSVDVTSSWRVSGSSVPYVDSIPAWAKEYVDYTYRRNLMQGVSATIFAGSDNVDRASLWTILSRMDGNYPKTTGTPWYTESRSWAMNQVTNGQALSDGTNPTAQVSREQVATMLYRYAGSLGKNVSNKADLASFVDGSKVSSWAQEAMRWACASGVIGGKDGRRLDPQGNATRNEIAKMIACFCTELGL